MGGARRRGADQWRDRGLRRGLDSHTLEKLPRRFIKFTCEEEYGTFSRFEFEESDLETAEPRDTLEEAIVTQRQLFHRYFWGNIKEDEQAARIYEIMLRAPAEDDISNWATYFSNDVAYPFAAVVEGTRPATHRTRHGSGSPGNGRHR
ncbi:MAG: hypothetical protein H6558_08750 [Lewinellaceae bacterium]|nr:hypothetical protein [Lewinellaceae bacterium]